MAETQNKNKPKSEPSAKPGFVKKKSPSYVSITAFLVALLAIAIALYTLQSNQHLNEALATQNTLLSERLTHVKTQQTAWKDTQETLVQSLQQKEKDIEDQFNTLQQQFKRIVEQKNYENQDWMLLKARYYLELAQINAHWSDDFTSTVALLEQADSILSNVSTSNVLTIRQAIAKDIASLKASPQVDVVGLLSELDAASQMISKLPLPAALAPSEETAPQDKPNQKVWRERLQDSVNILEKLVVVRRHDEEIKPLLSPLYLAVVRESIRLNLQEAQWAVLKKNEQVYQMALNQAIHRVKQHFDVKAQTTSELLKQLEKLKEKELDKPKPSIDKALPLLNQGIEQKTSKQVPMQPSQRQGEPD